jgi:hypothetical protein
MIVWVLKWTIEIKSLGGSLKCIESMCTLEQDLKKNGPVQRSEVCLSLAHLRKLWVLQQHGTEQGLAMLSDRSISPIVCSQWWSSDSLTEMYTCCNQSFPSNKWLQVYGGTFKKEVSLTMCMTNHCCCPNSSWILSCGPVFLFSLGWGFLLFSCFADHWVGFFLFRPEIIQYT